MSEINHGDYDVRIANRYADVSALKTLDDLAFAGHRGISMHELYKVKENGVLLILYNVHTGEIVGESQLLFQEIPEIPYSFKKPIAYMYAVAVRPDFQAQGLGRIIMRSVWAFALGVGANEVHLSVRVTNYPSLRLMFGQGYRIIGYREKFYGPNSIASPRVILAKKLNHVETTSTEYRTIPASFDGQQMYGETSTMFATYLREGFVGIAVHRDHGFTFAR